MKILNDRILIRKPNPYRELISKSGIKQPAKKRIDRDNGYNILAEVLEVGPNVKYLKQGDCIIVSNYKGTGPLNTHLGDNDFDNNWMLVVEERFVLAKVAQLDKDIGDFGSMENPLVVIPIGNTLLIRYKNPMFREHEFLLLPKFTDLQRATLEDGDGKAEVIGVSKDCKEKVLQVGQQIVTSKLFDRETIDSAFTYGSTWYAPNSTKMCDFSQAEVDGQDIRTLEWHHSVITPDFVWSVL